MFAEVAAVGAVPFVVLLDQHVPGEAEQRGGVRERADDVVARLISLLTRSRGLVDQMCRRRGYGNSANASRSFRAVSSMPAIFGCDPAAAFQQRREERPRPSFGIRNSSSPAVVVSVRSRDPLRCVTRSGVRSNGAAPMNAAASASISSW